MNNIFHALHEAKNDHEFENQYSLTESLTTKPIYFSAEEDKFALCS